MGIYGLDTFIKTKVKNGTFVINMEQSIQQEKLRTGKEVVLVVDLGCMKNRCCLIDAEILCGLRTEAYNARIDAFFQKLIKAGAKLVFFGDGPVQVDKHNSWFHRQNGTYENRLAIIDKIDQQTPFKEILTENFPTTDMVSDLLLSKANEYGTMHYSMENECDLELAAYATKNEAFAILADDSDFLIYAGKWQYWSIKQMNQEKMTTMAYNREELRAHLGLSQEQMPVFAALAGNDIITYKEGIGNFHKRIMWRGKFESIALYVKRLPLNFVENEEILDNITRDVFSHRADWQRIKGIFKKAIEIYNYNSIKTVKRSDFMKKLLKNDMKDVFILFQGYCYTITTGYQDLRDTSKKSTNEMTLEIIQKLVGYAFNHQNDPNLQMKTVIKMTHEDSYQQILFKPIYPQFNIPLPENIIFRDPNDGLDDKRKEILQWILLGSHNIPINTDKLFNLPQKFILPVATLFYLVKEGSLSIHFADIILLIVHNSTSADDEPPEYLQKDAFTVAFLYLKMYRYILRVFTSIGLRDFATQVKFDGFVFHKLHQKSLNLCDIDVTQIEKMRIIYL